MIVVRTKRFTGGEKGSEDNYDTEVQTDVQGLKQAAQEFNQAATNELKRVNESSGQQ